MLAYRSRQLVRTILDNTPWPSTIIGLALVVVIGLLTAGSTWPPMPTTNPSAPAATVVITPDDPAAPRPVPVQVLER
jgi:hypothetical protein